MFCFTCSAIHDWIRKFSFNEYEERREKSKELTSIRESTEKLNHREERKMSSGSRGWNVSLIQFKEDEY